MILAWCWGAVLTGQSLECAGQGIGTTRDEAIAAARRDAVVRLIDDPEGGFRPGAASSRRRQPRWVRRLVLAQAASLCDSSRVIGQRKPIDDPVSGRWTVQVQVVVPEARLKQRWAECESFVGWIGSPTVALAIDEEIILPNRERDNESRSEFAQVLKQALLDEGFRVRIASQAASRRHRDLKTIAGKIDEDAALVEESNADDADLFLEGVARAYGPKRQRDRYAWTADCEAELFWADGGGLVGTVGGQRGRGSSEEANGGATIAIRHAARSTASEFLDTVFRHWARWAVEGRRVTIKVVHKDYDEGRAVRKALKAMVADTSQMSELESEVGDSLSIHSVATRLPKADLMDLVADMPLDGRRLRPLKAPKMNSMILSVQVR